MSATYLPFAILPFQDGSESLLKPLDRSHSSLFPFSGTGEVLRYDSDKRFALFCCSLGMGLFANEEILGVDRTEEGNYEEGGQASGDTARLDRVGEGE